MSAARHPVKFVRWARDAGWRDTLGVLIYPFQTWRCVLFGHRWGKDHFETEWAGYPVHVSTWHECIRPHCCAYEEPWNIWEQDRYMARAGEGNETREGTRDA